MLKHWKSIIPFNRLYYSWEYTITLWIRPQIRIWHTNKGTDDGYILIPKSFFENSILHNGASLFRQWSDII